MCMRCTLNQLQRAIHAGISVAQQIRIEWEPFYNHIPHAVCNCAVWLVRRCRCTTSTLKMTPAFTPGLTFCGLHFLHDCASQLHAIMMHLCNEHSMSHALVCLTMWLLWASHSVPRHALQGSLVCHTCQYRSCAEFSKTATPLTPAVSVPRSKQLARRYNRMPGSHCTSASVSVHDIHATSAQVQETTTATMGCRTQGLCRRHHIITCILSCIIASAGLTGENGWFWSEGMHISMADPRLLTRVLTSEDHSQCQNRRGSAADANTFMPDCQSATHYTCTNMQEWTTSHVDQRLQPSQCSFLIASVHAGACAPMNAPGLQSPTSEDICWALSKTPLRKAVPRHMAPGVSWRAAAEEVCPTVLSAVCAAWSTFEVPQPWKDGWLVLAQKPQKPGRDPSDYRPLCLQDPCGKAMILWMEEILHRFYNADFLQPRTPFLTLALKASRNKFVPMTEILHRLRQNSCQC